MLRLPLLPSGGGRNLDLGGGDAKDKLMLGALVLVIIAAIVALVWSVSSTGDTSITRREVTAICVDPECGHIVETNYQGWGNMVQEVPDEILRGMDPPRALCPKCQNPKFTLIQTIECPACGHRYPRPQAVNVARRAVGIREMVPAPAQMACPECGVEFDRAWSEARRGR